MVVRLTHKEFMSKFIKVKPNFKVLQTYVTSQTKIKFKHLDCGTEFFATPNNMLKKEYGGCPVCANINRTNTKRKNSGMGMDNFIKKVKEKYPDGLYRVVPGQIYINNKTKYNVICKECGNIFPISPVNILKKNNPRGCPICNNIKNNKESKGIIRIKKYLDEHNILYEQEMGFEGCCYKNNLHFDFIIYYNDISDDPKDYFLLEFDGAQHFRPLNSSKEALKKFEDTIKRDEIKNKFCEEYGLTLKRISYNQSNEIESLLEKYCQ